MATKKKTEQTLTRAEKTDGAKKIILKILETASLKSADLIDAAAKEYAAQYENNDNPNDVKGRIGSVLDVMKKDGEVTFNGGVYEMKPVEKPKKRATKAKKTETITATEPTATKAETKTEEQPQPKKRGRKPKQPQESVIEATIPQEEVKAEAQPETKEETKSEEQPKGTLMDMSFLLGEKTQKLLTATATSSVTETKADEKTETSAKAEEKVVPEKEAKGAQQEKSQVKPVAKPVVKTAVAQPKAKPAQKAQTKPAAPSQTKDEKLQEAFLERLHKLGGDYFEYYSVYLLEKYSRRSGRRLEALKICGGERDGGIDGEIELTDKLGFRETVYIQAKNWDADKGNKKLWVVGETLLQQFLGACAVRQAQEGKQHCRGIFITTSKFTPDAQRLLEVMSDKLVGYDGADLYETAKECEFGIIKKNGEWALDEDLLSGKNAFFRNF